MSKVLIEYIGDYWELSPDALFGSHGDEVTAFYDREGVQSADRHLVEQSAVVDYYAEDSYREKIIGVMPVDSLVLYSGLAIHDKEDCEKKLSRLLAKIFLSLKGLYAPLLSARRGNVWVLSPAFSCSQNTAADLQSLSIAFSSGVRALTQVFALELARRQIPVNHVKMPSTWGNSQQPYEKLAGIITWAGSQREFFMTAQEIEIGSHGC